MDFIADIIAVCVAYVKKSVGFQSVCYTVGGRTWVRYHWRYSDALESVRLNSACCKRGMVVRADGLVLFEVSKVIRIR